jgi:large subunit ribosomal protein L35
LVYCAGFCSSQEIKSGLQVSKNRLSGGAPARHNLSKTRTFIMPKMKTKKSAAKRFQVRGSGSIKRGQAFKRHILTKKTTKNKRQLRGSAAVHETNMASVKAMMPFA